MTWIKVNIRFNQVDDFITAVEADGKKICIIKTDGQLFATQRKCPHAGADLSRGFCKNGKLICPYHRYSYNLATGKGDIGQGDYIEIYPIEIRNNSVYINMPEKWKFFKNLFRKL